MSEEHLHLLDAVLESVVVLCMTSGAMAVVVVPFGFAKAGFFSVCPVVLGVVATAEEGTQDAKAHAGVCACGCHPQGANKFAQ